MGKLQRLRHVLFRLFFLFFFLFCPNQDHGLRLKKRPLFHIKCEKKREKRKEGKKATRFVY